MCCFFINYNTSSGNNFSEEVQEKISPTHRLMDEDSSDNNDPCSTECSSDEENEIQQLLSTLQRVYNEVCSPPRTRPTTPGEEVKEEMATEDCIVEGWVESDDDSEEEEEGSMIKELQVFNRLEETRSTLENVMGMEKLMEAYTVIQVCVLSDLVVLIVIQAFYFF